MFHHLQPPSEAGVGVAFTDATLNLADTADAARRQADFAALAARLDVDVAVVRQVHGNRVVEAVGGRPWSSPPEIEADALVTTTPGLALAVRVADCIPLVFAASAGVIGAAHAGRAGILNGVIAATVTALRDRGGENLHAWIGPHVCGACYEVPEAMARDFADATSVPPTRTAAGTTGVDLGAAARRQLDALEVPFDSFEDCTMHTAGLWSHRRQGAAAGRLAGLVWLAPTA